MNVTSALINGDMSACLHHMKQHAQATMTAGELAEFDTACDVLAHNLQHHPNPNEELLRAIREGMTHYVRGAKYRDASDIEGCIRLGKNLETFDKAFSE